MEYPMTDKSTQECLGVVVCEDCGERLRLPHQRKRFADWPEDLPLPTKKDAEEGRLEGKRILQERQEARRGKIIAGGDAKMSRTQVTI